MTQNINTSTVQSTNLLLLITGIVTLAAISLYFTIFLPYYGEEGQYTIPPLEMIYHHSYWVPLTYGIAYWRPPLFNWLVIGGIKVLGGQHVLIVARLITATASVLIGLVLWWFSYRLFQQRLFAVFTVAIYFSGDLLFRRGWIAYSDPVFSLFIFIAICLLWLGHKEQRISYLIPIPWFLFAAFITKALTVYIFYSMAILVLYWGSKNRRYFFSLTSIIIHLLALALPLLWLLFAPGHHGYSMLGDISQRLIGADFDWIKYGKKIFSTPFEILLRLAPMDLLALYAWYYCCKKNFKLGMHANTTNYLDSSLIKSLLWFIGLSIVPYWLAVAAMPIRYLMPLYPLLAIVMGYIIWRAGKRMMTIAVLVLMLELAIKCGSSFYGLPWFEHMSYAPYHVANDIIRRSHKQPLYVNFSTALGLTLTSIIDAKKWPQAPLQYPPPQFKNGYIISYMDDPRQGKLLQYYDLKSIGGVYLLSPK